jgi:hypothetical protein
VREGEPLWVVLTLPVIVLIAGGAVGWAFLSLYCPRRLSHLDQLEPFVGTT